MLPHHQRIAEEIDAGARDAKRERRRVYVWTLAACWICVAIGGALMGEALNTNASVGPVYFPELMDRADRFWKGGLFIGTAGPIASLLVGWRIAMNRGLLD
jgi:hypothetical protein